VVISLGAILAIPFEDIIQNEEYALAAGAGKVLDHWGTDLVILGALLATSSAISGTVFGASRQMSVIAKDGYLPAVLARRVNRIPVNAIISMAVFAFLLVLAGNLKIILEFGSVTFLLVSLLMAFANYKIRDLTHSSAVLTIIAISGLMLGTALIIYYDAGLALGTALIIYYEFSTQYQQMFFIGGLYALLTLGSWLYSRGKVYCE